MLFSRKFELLKIPYPKLFKVFVHILDVVFIIIQLFRTW